MGEIGIIGIVLIAINGIISYKGFNDSTFTDRYCFSVDEILIYKDYKRLITSGFLHVNWMHFIFNMVALYLFSSSIESFLGIPKFLLIYLGSLLGGNFFALYIHRNYGNYRAVGASGAISGIIFASIALFKGMEIGLFFIPISIPGWLYGLLFVLFSIYGIKSQQDSIGHEAHLGGGIIGLIFAIMLEPKALFYNSIPVALILIPTLVFLFIILLRPEFLLFRRINFGKTEGVLTVDDKYNTKKVNKEQELNALLDKISKKGIHKLTEEEKKKLKKLSEN